MPMMPAFDAEKPVLKSTGEATNLLGYACSRYEIRQRGETLEIWATDQLFAFRAWLPNQPAGFGPRRIEDRWAELLRERKLFPLLATLKSDQGPERLRFEVKSITPEEVKDQSLFQTPPDYQEIPPLPN